MNKNDQLYENLEYLKLGRIQEIYAEVAKQAAKDNLTHVEYLKKLVSEETSKKFERNVLNKTKQAHFPLIKTITTFDFKHPEKINKQQILELLGMDFVSRNENVIFLGPSSVGKTHIALALGQKACSKGISTNFTTAIDAINHLNAANCDNTFIKCMKQYTRPRLLIIDELGYLPIDKQGASLLFQIISQRYERGSIILTCNRAFKEWGELFNDNSLASAVIDRLIHHSTVVKINGESYCVKNRKNKRQLK